VEQKLGRRGKGEEFAEDGENKEMERYME